MSEIKQELSANGSSIIHKSDDARFFLASIIEFLEDSVVSVDFNTVITSWNKGAERLYGYSAEEVIGKPLTILTLPADLQQVLANIEIVRHGGKVQVYESERIHKDGHHIHLSITLSPVKNDRGEIIGVSTLARDITERKLSEEALRETESQFNSAVAVAQLGAFEWNVLTHEVVLDRRSCEIFNFAQGEGKRAQEIFDRIHPSDYERVFAEAQASIQNASRLETEYRINLPDGTIRTINSISEAILGKNGKTEKLLGVFKDITARKRNEESLREAHKRITNVLESITDCFYALDSERRFTYVNPQTEAYYGIPKEQMLGRTFTDVLPKLKGHEIDRRQQEAIRGGTPVHFETISPTTGKWVELHFYPTKEGLAAYFRNITERKQAEEKIRESETRYRTLFNSIDEGFCFIEMILGENGKPVDYRFIETNPAFVIQTGLENAEGKTIREFAPNHEEFWFETYGKIALTGEAVRFNHQAASLNRWFDVYAFRVGGKESHKVAVLFNDISRQKTAEEKLQQSQEMLRLAMASSRMGAWSRNLLTDEVYWSPELEAIFGVPTGTFSGTIGGFYEFIYEEDKESIRQTVQKAIAERQSYIIEFRYHHADGSVRWMEGRGQAIYSEDGKPTNVYGIGIDISERKRAELNARFLSEVSQDLVRISTPEEIVQIVGERLNAFIGTSMCAFIEISESADTAKINYDWHEEEASSLIGVYKLSDFVTSEFLQIAMSGEPIIILDIETDSRIADPQPWRSLKIGAHLNVPLIRNAEWRFSLAVYHQNPYNWRADEITLMQELSSRVWSRLERSFAEQERERLLTREQAARHQAEEASRLKDEFLATVSHELRTPLNAILGWSQMLASNKFSEDETARALKTIYRNAKSQAQLIEDILDVSRVITGKLRINAKPITLTPIIQTAVESLRPSIEAKQLRLLLGLDFGTETVHADPERIQQVLWNLLSNAIKFTPDKGQITIQLESSESEMILTVSDTGKGISSEFLPFVFDRFRQADSSTTRQHGGLGLGLAIVRHIVELHGGTVEVKSEGEEKGTTFIVRLPISETPSTFVETTNGNNSKASESDLNNAHISNYQSQIEGLRILLIDDEMDTLEVLAAFLANKGAEVKSNTNVRDALETIKEWKPNVIISDIAMPEEDGYSFIKKLRALPPEEGGTIPAVALTAYVGIKERTQVLSRGFQLYVPKPIEPFELLAALESLV
jgi:PAS domain S-box-containing protein